jgi:plasmid stabilization system protein ParE
MKVRLSEDGQADAERADAWWREHRPASPRLFADELGLALDLLSVSPGAGEVYKNLGGRALRRTLLEKTRQYVYHYAEDETVIVIAIWSTERGHGPPLRFA